ncbi:hypothetical protein ScalyP_jg4298 [Parmales sp. scaly parma]|nr:hypothetical protein ScalyP_jg4298 [Parmales sp. scaly parma]
MSLSSTPSPLPPDPENENNNNNNNNNNKTKKPNPFRIALSTLSRLSLIDYSIRKAVFNKTSVIPGPKEVILGLRPMDTLLSTSASTPIPIGATDIPPDIATDIPPDIATHIATHIATETSTAELQAVRTLLSIMEGEALRAERIISSGGKSVAPSDIRPEDLRTYPLRGVEEGARNLVREIVEEERRRNRNWNGNGKGKGNGKGNEKGNEKPFGKLKQLKQLIVKQLITRPSLALEPGPLGKSEQAVIDLFTAIVRAERARKKLGEQRNELVRPIDVAEESFLSDLEASVAKIVREERRREQTAKGSRTSSSDDDDDSSSSSSFSSSWGTIVRPMESSTLGPLGIVERDAVAVLERVRREETERLEKLLEERPMNRNRRSVPGFVEAFVVGLVRFPILISKVFGRVSELVEEEEENDNGI